MAEQEISTRITDRAILLLLFCFGALCFLWPSFHIPLRIGSEVITQPFVRLLGLAPEGSLEKPREREPFSEIARRIEFRVEQYRVEPALIQSWCKEWNCDSNQELFMLRLLLQQLPEAWSKENPELQRKGLVDSILFLSSECQKKQPQNAFGPISEALAYFYSGQDEALLKSLKKAQNCSEFDSGLKLLNQSEYELWRKETRTTEILPVQPRVWQLNLERPFHALSRGLSLYTRSHLQKYNVERGVELALLHLHLAQQLSEASMTPADYTVAQALVQRAIEPFWSKPERDPSLPQLKANFEAFLDDQGDKLNLAKVHSWFLDMEENEKTSMQRLPIWRKLQTFTTWNASSVFTSLMFQTLSSLIVWGTVAAFTYRSGSIRPLPSMSLPALSRYGILHLSLATAPIIWTFTQSSIGGFYLITGLLGSWLLWWILLVSAWGKLSLEAVHASIARSLLTLLTALMLLTCSLAYMVSFRERYLEGMITKGWLS
jgi:hypothetical protein